jgi:predicted PurR-regulated permease PerM
MAAPDIRPGHPHPPDAAARDTDPTIPLHVSVRSASLTVLALAAAMAVLHWAQAVFVPIVLSTLIAYALDPIVRWLMRAHLPRMAASAVIVVALTSAFGYTGYSLADDTARIVAALPEAAARLRQEMRPQGGEPSTIQRVQEAAEELQRTADEAAGSNPAAPGVQRVQVEQPAIDVREYISWGSASLVAFAGQAMLVIFFVFFLLASGDLFKRKLVKLAGPSLEKKKITVQILDDINLQIERFLVVHAVTSVIVGVATWIAFRTMGLEQAGVWALAAGILNSIPYFGPVLVTGGVAVVAFLQFGTISMALYVAAVALAITSIEGWLLKPLLTRRATHVNEVAIFVALIFWSFIWGIWGTLLAVPMLAAFKACCDRIDDLKPIGELLGE